MLGCNNLHLLFCHQLCIPIIDLFDFVLLLLLLLECLTTPKLQLLFIYFHISFFNYFQADFQSDSLLKCQYTTILEISNSEKLKLNRIETL